jgi:sulfite reductase (NADPH) hemoprotein beta-component
MAAEKTPLKAPELPPSPVEGIKIRSQYLRGTLAESLADPLTGALRPDDVQLCKFHGFYQQDDRDIRAERVRQKLEPLQSFMLRICVPGGTLTPAQWLALDGLADKYGDGGLRVTSRQAVQLHGVVKHELKSTISAIHRASLSTLAACGDVNRNVMGAPLADSPTVYEQVFNFVRELSVELAPKTGAYHELWLDGKPVKSEAHSDENAEEPLYGKTYLPRKFKCAVVIPPDNDVDIYTQDLGFVAVVEGETVLGFNVLVGGGMGRAHGDATTYPRLATSFGFIEPKDLISVAKAVLTTQRDFGNRGERHHSRLKYTIDRLGVAAFREEVERRVGKPFLPVRDVTLTTTVDRNGWHSRAGQEHLHLFLPCGRVRDTEKNLLRTALRELAKLHEGEIRLTGNQNLILTNVSFATKSKIQAIVEKYGLLPKRSGLRLASLGCVALPTCSLAMAEAERYLPSLLSKIESQLVPLGLEGESIVIRMTGCPNGCARPYNAEIAFVGRAPKLYDLYLGGSRNGTRLATLAATNLDESAILSHLEPLFQRYAKERQSEEGFGDFYLRTLAVSPASN